MWFLVRVLKPCGTEAAYRRHLKNSEPPCDDCRKAAREARVAQRNKSKALCLTPGELAVLNDEQVLREVLEQLRLRLPDAPPNAAAPIAKGIRDTLEALRSLSEPKEAERKAGVIDEIAKRRQARQDRLTKAKIGKNTGL